MVLGSVLGLALTAETAGRDGGHQGGATPWQSGWTSASSRRPGSLTRVGSLSERRALVHWRMRSFDNVVVFPARFGQYLPVAIGGCQDSYHMKLMREADVLALEH